MKRLFELALLAAGSRRHQFLNAVRASILGSVAQAGAYAVLIGVIYELTQPDPNAGRAWAWFGAFVALYLVEASMRLRELSFQYEDWARVMSDTRLALGDK